MPKVTEEYIQKKKQKILEATYQLCLEKTMSTVTMQDIINRTGLSQGGIYRFYHDIDEIFSDMILELRKKVNLKEKIDILFSQADHLNTEEIVNEVFAIVADFLTDNLMGSAKIDFELSILAMNAPGRVEKILRDIQEIGNMEYIRVQTSQFFIQRAKNGKLQPRVKLEEVMTFISSSFVGIQMNCIVNCCYNKIPMSEWYEPKMQLMTLAKSVNYLLGVED